VFSVIYNDSFALDFRVEILFNLLKFYIILLFVVIQIYHKMLIMALVFTFSTNP